MKNPVILAIIATALVFTVMYYWYNPSILGDKNDKDKKKKDGKSTKESKDKKKTKEGGINETVVISAAIAGLATWYIASSYFTEKQGSDTGRDSSVQGSTGSDSGDQSGILTGANQSSVQKQQITDGGMKGGSKTTSKVPHISSDDPTRSYNLIGSGLNIPRSELNIPNVLIDYK